MRLLQSGKIRQWILGRLINESVREPSLDEFEVRFFEIREYKGYMAALLWYVFQIVSLFIQNIKISFNGSFAMLRNYFLIALRNLNKNKTYSILNIAGLAVGLTAFILIALYVQYELSYDRYHENADRIFRVVRSENRTKTPAALAPAFMETFPEVVSAARIIQNRDMLISRGQNHIIEEEFYWADPEIFDIFTLPFVEGDPKSALTEPFSIVLSEKTTIKYFGNENPIGQTLTVNDNIEFKVGGVFCDMPDNCHFVMDVIVPYTTFFQVSNNDVTSWTSNFSYTYFILQEGASPEELQNKIHPILERPLFIRAGIEEPYPEVFFIQPVKEIHLHSHRMQEISVNNDIKYILLFSAIGFFILLVACINYMNMATARSVRRGKEVGMRKMVGARRKQLVVQFLSESVTITVLAMIISLGMILIVLPAFNRLVERPLQLNPINNPQLFVGLILIIVFVGLFSGSYPALLISGFKPITVLRGSFTKSSKGSSLRNALVLVQFSITIILIVCTLTVQEQLKFVKNRDAGYAKEQIITLGTRDRIVRQNIEAIKTELLQNSDITAVATSERLPNDIDTFMSRYLNENKPEELITIFYNSADYDFVDLYDISIVEGRNFSRDFPSDQNGVYLVNEAAVRAAEWESPVGLEFTPWEGRTGTIVGVMKDFHLQSLHSPIAPLFIFFEPSNFSNISIKINTSHIPATLAYVKSVMEKFSPHYPFDYSFFDAVYDQAYHTEERMVNIFSSFAVLAIIIACLGLFGLAAFAAEQRTKEISIRKVMGASTAGIFFLLSKEFIKWVLIANIIAWPVAYFYTQKWLQGFAYRMKIPVWMYFFSALLALFISFLTVSWQAYKASVSNPMKSLKYE